MSNEEINRKIAEACGLRKTTECDDCYGTGYGGSECDHIPCDTCKTTGRVAPYFQNLPDYCSDLNAIAEAINSKFTSGQYVNWCFHLEEICGGHAVAYNATARQRALAFVYTWPDGREEVRYRRVKGSPLALEMIEWVQELQRRDNDSP